MKGEKKMHMHGRKRSHKVIAKIMLLLTLQAVISPAVAAIQAGPECILFAGKMPD